SSPSVSRSTVTSGTSGEFESRKPSTRPKMVRSSEPPATESFSTRNDGVVGDEPVETGGSRIASVEGFVSDVMACGFAALSSEGDCAAATLQPTERTASSTNPRRRTRGVNFKGQARVFMLLAAPSYVTKRSRSNNVPTVSAPSSCEIELKKAGQ